VLAHYGTTTSNVVWLGLTLTLLIAGFITARRTPEGSLVQDRVQSSTT
jgi:LPXTG-motif cell wall-anchored protein